MPHAPLPIQFLGYFLVGGFCAVANLLFFNAFLTFLSAWFAAPLAFILTTILNYWLCILVLFRHRAKWSTWGELGIYSTFVAAVGCIDLFSTLALLGTGFAPWAAKATASGIAFVFNYLDRRFLIFPERRPGPWSPAGVR
jgi:putative flippase GtrA